VGYRLRSPYYGNSRSILENRHCVLCGLHKAEVPLALLESRWKSIIHKGRSLVMEDLWNSRSAQARTSDRLHISLKYRSFLACQKILDRSLL